MNPHQYASDSSSRKGKGSGVGQRFIDNLRFALNFAMVFEGITTGYWYLGGRDTMAPMHVEDTLLESFSYLFSGDAKQWIFIPGVWTKPLISKLLTAGGEHLVSLFLGKMLVIPLETLDMWGIPYYSATQEEGWFVLTTGTHMVRRLWAKKSLLAMCGHVPFVPEILLYAIHQLVLHH